MIDWLVHCALYKLNVDKDEVDHGNGDGWGHSVKFPRDNQIFI